VMPLSSCQSRNSNRPFFQNYERKTAAFVVLCPSEKKYNDNNVSVNPCIHKQTLKETANTNSDLK